MGNMPNIREFNERALDNSVRLVEVTDEHAHLLPQLVGKDDVHDFGTQDTDALQKYRIGGNAYKKTVFAITDADGKTVYSAIYVFKTPKTLETFADVPGNVGHILTQKSRQPLHGLPTAFVFYSITNILGPDRKPIKPGAGGMLISGLLNEADLPQVTLSTLSPLRTLGKSFERQDDEVLSHDQRLALAYLHLLERTNPVQQFHMGNGAGIGDIKLRASIFPDMPDVVQGLNVMVNYHYPNDKLQRADNRARFNAIARGDLTPGRLRDLMDPQVLARVDALNGMVEAMAGRLTHRGRPSLHA